jgi:predicted  nucleic acid-binding Zn-ribbon protein
VLENDSKPSFFGSLIGGKQKDALEKANQQLETISDELQAKIEELGILKILSDLSERLHISFYDYKKEKESKIDQLLSKIETEKQLKKHLEEELKKLDGKIDTLQDNLHWFQDENARLKNDILEKSSQILKNEIKFNEEISKKEYQLLACNELIQEKIPYNEDKNRFNHFLDVIRLSRISNISKESLMACSELIEAFKVSFLKVLQQLINKMTLIQSYLNPGDEQLAPFYISATKVTLS